MSEMIERVARAIFASQANSKAFDEADRLTQQSVSMAARAAIDAMLEPTQAMVDAGNQEPLAYGCWQAMIDEAMKSDRTRDGE